MKQDIEFAVPLFKAGAEWRINSVWHSITVIPDCHRFIVFLPKKSTIGSKNPIMGILEENRTFISRTMSFSLTEEDFRVTMERDVELSEVARAVKNQHHKKKI